MTTLAQFRTSVSAEVGLDNTTGGDQPNIDLWVNQGVTDVLLRTGCRQRNATLTLTSGTRQYTLDTSIMLIKTAYVSTATGSFPLEIVSEEEIIAMQITSNASISPAQYYAVGGSDLFLIYPTPASSSDTVNIFYVPRPATLSLSSDAPSELPSEFHPAVEYYAFMRASSQTDDASAQNGGLYAQQYEGWIKRIRKDVALKGNRRLPLAHVRSRVQRLPFHDRSRYPT